MEEKYAIEQIVNAVMQADEFVVVAIKNRDEEMLKDAIRDFLN